MNENLIIRDAHTSEHQALDALMVEVYSNPDGFTDRQQHPNYDKMLADTHVLVALSEDGKLIGGVAYVTDMSVYGCGGTVPQQKNASGIRLLAVDSAYRGAGVGQAPINACIRLAKSNRHSHVVQHRQWKRPGDSMRRRDSSEPLTWILISRNYRYLAFDSD